MRWKKTVKTQILKKFIMYRWFTILNPNLPLMPHQPSDNSIVNNSRTIIAIFFQFENNLPKFVLKNQFYLILNTHTKYQTDFIQTNLHLSIVSKLVLAQIHNTLLIIKHLLSLPNFTQQLAIKKLKQQPRLLPPFCYSL